MSDRFDDDLSQPVAGAREASLAEGGTSPAVGRDEWVARADERRGGREGWLGGVERRLRAAPWWAWIALLVAVIAILPIGFESGYVRRVAFDTVIYMLLALGLNVVVGWGGLLDLAYVAFFGIGAFSYALLASDKFDVHVPTVVLLPGIAGIGALVGYLVGLPSRRLVGDYLAIVTLFFFQVFAAVAINGDDLFGTNVTGGPNGLVGIDPLSLFGRELPVATEGIFNVSYLYVALAIFSIIYVALRFLDRSRTGRAWRSLREDPLAAEMMGMPVASLKLLAFSFGASVAALTGSLTAALNGGVFPETYEFSLLITIYTMVILGGAGSQLGVVLGAIMISALLEILREPGDARLIFYTLIVLGLFGVLRFSLKLVVALGGTLAFGFVARAVAGQIDDSWTAGAGSGGGRVAERVSTWVVVPNRLAEWVGPAAYVGLIALLLVLTLLQGWWRVALLIPVLYLGAFVWENVMLVKPEPTRYILLGAILVATMIARPSGLLGERRVEIV